MNKETKIDRIIRHLEELEKIVGKPLLSEPRFELTDCPIENFAPEYNNEGYQFNFVTSKGEVFYKDNSVVAEDVDDGVYDSIIELYEVEDSLWWSSLSNWSKRNYTNKIIKYLKERDK